MATPTKTLGTNVLTMQSVTAGSLVVGSAVDVSTLFSALLAIRFGRGATTALTAGVTFNVQWSSTASDDYGWNSYLVQPIVSETTAAESEAVTGTVSATATAITMASTTNLTVGEWISIINGTAANSEIRQIKAVTTNTSVTVDAIQNAQTGATVYDQAQVIPVYLDLRHIKRIRLVVDAVGAGQVTYCSAALNSLDEVG